jgi:FMN phosphatase YigB (HAD superfamily)
LITNGPSDVQRRKLAQYGLTDAFDPIVISQEAGHAKPDPRIFQEAARRAGAEASACVMVGDLLFADVRGGRASGWRTVWVRRARDIGPEHARLDECAEEERPHDVVGDLNGLLDLFAE